jgi:transposase, IS5 family
LRLAIRYFRHVKKRAKTKRALKRLRTLAGILIRELPQHCLFECYQQDFLLYERILKQQIKDTDKIYSLHEPQVYSVVKEKDHKQYEYGSKASISCTARREAN